MSSMLDATPSASRSGSLAAALGTLGVHGLLVLGASLLGLGGVAQLKKAMPATEMVEIELPEPAPPEPAKPEPKAAPAPRAKLPTAASEPPPSAAQAGQVLDAKADVVDFGETFVSGSGDNYAGGVTDSSGTSKTAVRDSAARSDAAGKGTGPAQPAVDLSRPPELMGGDSWSCPFPIEADDAGIDVAVATLRLAVGADGGIESVSVSSDPGSGFGREARRCAASKRFKPGLDREGRPVAKVFTVNVRFRR